MKTPDNVKHDSFSTLIEQGVLIRRYKRFLADVELADGQVVVVHCPNPGSMLGCAEPGSPVFLRKSPDPKRKLPYTWVITQSGSTLISVDTLLANKVVGEALRNGLIPALSSYRQVASEYTFGDSRFDFCLFNDGAAGSGQPAQCLVEVKSTTLCDGAVAMFPDAKTERGRKHLYGLMEARRQGIRAVQFYCVSRNDAKQFQPARHIDPKYADALVQAVENGVEVMAWTINLSVVDGISAAILAEEIPIFAS